jgi:Tol biopolymer transport system component
MKPHLLLLLAVLLYGPAPAQETPLTNAANLVQFTFPPDDRSNDHDPTFSPDGEWIAFVSIRETGKKRLWKKPVRGGAAQQLTFGDEDFVDWYPAWSPDGSRIAFTSNRGGKTHAWTVPAAGGDPTRISSAALGSGEGTSVGSTACSWSPDNLYLACSALVDGNTDIYTISVAEGTAARITTHPADDRWPDWSPDGREIVFASNREDNENIWIVAAQGGPARLLQTGHPDGRFPRWSPDGRWIVFQRAGEGVFIAPARGGTATEITGTDNYFGVTPEWSPDGSRVAFTGGMGRMRMGKLAVIPAAGGQPQVLADAEVSFWQAPAWSPDGRQIAFTTPQDQLAVVPASGGPVRTLLSGEGRHDQPSWSPDGRQIAFSSSRSGSPKIWTVPAAGGEADPVTWGSGRDYHPAWSPDGETLAFASLQEGGVHIWTVPASGGRPVQLTTHPSRDWDPFWLSGGAEIGFLSNRNRGGWSVDMWIMSAAGGTPREFFSEPNSWSPALSPDGRRIAYAIINIHDVSRVLYVVELEGDKSPLKLDDGMSPAWSPDGSRIAYYQGGDIFAQIWLADVSHIVESRANPEL